MQAFDFRGLCRRLEQPQPVTYVTLCLYVLTTIVCLLYTPIDEKKPMYYTSEKTMSHRWVVTLDPAEREECWKMIRGLYDSYGESYKHALREAIGEAIVVFTYRPLGKTWLSEEEIRSHPVFGDLRYHYLLSRGVIRFLPEDHGTFAKLVVCSWFKHHE